MNQALRTAVLPMTLTTGSDIIASRRVAVDTDAVLAKPPMKATRAAYGVTLIELGKADPRVCALDADLAGSTQSQKFGDAFPGRFLNMGIAEANMAGHAAGLAAAGMVPFMSSFAIFATGRAWEAVRQSIAYPKLNAKIVASHGGVSVGEDGGSHQMLEDFALMRCLPTMAVLCPADFNETILALRAIHAHVGPVYLRTGRADVPVFLPPDMPFAIGKGAVLREGGDVALLGCGLMTFRCLEAAAVLATEGIQATVANLTTLAPMDTELIGELSRTVGAFVTAEEHAHTGGLGTAVAEALTETVPAPLERVAMRSFGQSGKAFELLDHYGLNAAGIAAAARKVLRRRGRTQL